MKHIFAGVSLLLLSLSMSPASTTNQPAEYWSTVAAPPTAPRYAQDHWYAVCSNYTWFYDYTNPVNPFCNPSPGGVIKVSNCIIDLDGRFGTPSQETTLTVQRGWQMWGGAWNQPVVEDAQGIAWRVEFVSINAEDQYPQNPWKAGDVKYFYTGWQGQYLANEIAPYSSHSPSVELLTEDASRQYTWQKFPKGGRNTAVAGAPVVVVSNIPFEPFEIAYCRVTESGETALSPPHLFTPPTLTPAGTTPAAVCNISYAIMDNHPQGTLGYHVYRRVVGGEWKRLPAPHCYGTPATPDDWLHPVYLRQINLRRYIDNAPTHQPAPEAKSRLTKIHRLLRGDATKDKDILFEYLRLPDTITPITTTVDVPMIGMVQMPTGQVTVRESYDETYVNVDATGKPVSMKRTYVGDVIVKPSERFVVHCPVVDEWGNNDEGTTGAGGDQKFRRRIRSQTNGGWTIEQAASQSGHNSWPAVVITNSYSRWIGATILAHGGDAVASDSPHGGNCFGNHWIECTLLADSVAGRVTCGIRIDKDCSSWEGSHTASEWMVKDCTINAAVPLWLCGKQTANFVFANVHANSYSTNSRGCICYTSYNPSPINFSEFYCDAYAWHGLGWTRGVIFRNDTAPATVHVSKIWCDQGFTRFIETNNQPFQLKLTEGKLNYRGAKPLLGLFTGTTVAKSTWYVDSTQSQPDPSTQGPYVVNNSYRLMEYLYERTDLKTTTLREPEADVALLMRRRLFGEGATLTPRDEPGYRVNVDVPVLVTRERTQAEIAAAFAAMPKINNLPEWGKLFITRHWLRYVTEPGTKRVTTIFNSLATGEKMKRELVTLPPQ